MYQGLLYQEMRLYDQLFFFRPQEERGYNRSVGNHIKGT